MNRSSDSVLSVYSDARAEYTKQLCFFLVPAYFQFFIDLLEKSKRESEPKKALWQFQTYLNEVHDWNMEKVHQEIQKINSNCGCDYLEDLLTAVFVAHTKVLTAIRLSSNKKKIEISVPKVDHFLFKVLCETSKLLWSSTYLFRDGISSVEKQQNYRTIEQIINEGILQAVRSLIPVKSILKDFVNNEGEEESDEEKDDKEEKEEKDDKDEAEEKEELTIPQSLSVKSVTEIPPPVSLDVPISSVPEATTTEQPVQPIEPVQSIQSIEPVHAEHIAKPKPQSSQTIIIDDKPTVSFGEYDAVFDSENPQQSDMIYDPKDGDENDVPALEILDDQGTSLAEGIDFYDLDNREAIPEDLATDDYESLS
jgi:Family of unknown function (DUF5764)